MKKINLKNIDQTIYLEKIDNGLDVYMLPNKNVENYYISFVARYGSIDTEFKIDDKKYKVSDGIAHFLEHVNFNVDDNSTAHELFKKYGSYINAYTTYDHTAYIVNSSGDFKDNLNLLLDYVQNGYFTEKLIEKEKGIIVEEVRRSKNNIARNLMVESNKALFINNKRDIAVVGEESDVRGITLDEVKLVHNTFYNPNNMFVVITGNFKIKEAVEVIKENQAKKKYLVLNVNKIHLKEPVKVEDKLVIVNDDMVEIPKSIISYKLDRTIYGDYDDVELLNYFYIIMNNNFESNSLLYEDLKEKNMITRMFVDCNIFDNILVISVIVEADKIHEVVEIIKDKMKHLDIEKDDIVRKRRVNIANLINQYDDIEEVNLDIVRSLIIFDKVYDNLYDIYNEANLDRAEEVIKRMNLENESIVILEK